MTTFLYAMAGGFGGAFLGGIVGVMARWRRDDDAFR